MLAHTRCLLTIQYNNDNNNIFRGGFPFFFFSYGYITHTRILYDCGLLCDRNAVSRSLFDCIKHIRFGTVTLFIFTSLDRVYTSYYVAVYTVRPKTKQDGGLDRNNNNYYYYYYIVSRVRQCKIEMSVASRDINIVFYILPKLSEHRGLDAK
jgi:hypothetical protein